MRMRTKLLPCLAAALAVGAISAPAASGATEVGSNCAGTAPIPSYTMLQLSQAGGSPLAAPAAGVVTKWKVISALPLPPGFTVANRLRTFRATGAPNEFQTIAESSLEVVQSGANTFATQIPVQAGDRFGAFAPIGSFVPVCPTTNAEDKLGLKEGDVAPGGVATYAPAENLQLALSVTIEPDADNDGFGDETQDKCPQSAALRDPCPPLLIEAAALSPGKGSVRILVASSGETSITASASATLPKTKKAKPSAATTLTPITQIIKPGQLAGFTLNFTRKLKQTLKGLPKSKSVKLKVTVSGQSAAAQLSTDTLTVKLKGQAKPKK